MRKADLSKQPYWFPLSLGVIIIVGLSACSTGLAGDITPPPGFQPTDADQPQAISIEYPFVPPDVSQGKIIYVQDCAPCHGITGQGNGPQAANLPDPVFPVGQIGLAHASIPAVWYQVITNGNINDYMPGFSHSLDDRQRWDVLAYVYSLSISSSTLAQGEKVYDANCSSCHGKTGKGDGPQRTANNIQVPDFLTQDRLSQKSDSDLFAEIKTGISQGPQLQMPAFSGKVSDADIWAVTSYIRALTFRDVPAFEVVSSGNITAGAKAMISRAAVQSPSPTAVPTTSQPTSTIGTSQTPDATTTGTARVGTVQGKLNMPTGAPLPAGLVVTLLGFDTNLQQVSSSTTTVQPDGTFVFSNVEMPSGRVFMTTVIVNNVTFNSSVSSGTDGTNLDLPITVYATSSDPSPLVVDRLHVFFDFSTPNVVQIVELYVISNPTDKAIVSDQGKPILTFELPQNATNLQFESGALGQRYIQTANGFGDTQAVLPGSGQDQEVFAFQLPYSQKLNLSLPVTIPVTAAVVMLPTNGVNLDSSQLVSSGQQNVQGQNFRVYASTNLTVGSSLAMILSGSPDAVASGETQNSLVNILIGSGVFVVTLVVAGLFVIRKREPKRPVVEKEIKQVTEEDANNLIDAIAALDDLYKAGKLPAAAYQQRRAEMKARLKEIVQETGIQLK